MSHEREPTITLEEEDVCRIAGDIIEFASENSFNEYEFLAAIHMVIEEFAERGIEIEIVKAKEGLN